MLSPFKFASYLFNRDYFPEFPLTGSCSDQAIFLEERTKEKDSTSPSFITQEKHSNKLLIEELNKIRLENDRLKLELTTKSDQWRQIKETLQNRQSVKRKLGHLLEDDSENRDPEKNEMLAETHLTRNLISEPEFDRISLLSKISDSKEDLRQPPYNTDQISNATTDEAGGMKPIAIIKKHDRDCPCCTKFYDAIKTGASDIEARKGIITRHKFRENMPGTPPGFWSVGFTQDS